MDDTTLKKAEKIIIFLDKVSPVPLLAYIAFSMAFSLQILTDLSNWQFYISTYLLGCLIAFILYSYDRDHISKKIESQEFEDLLIDSFCWGILGCIFYGLGVIILIKWVSIIVYISIDYQVNFKTRKYSDYSKKIRLNLKDSFNNFAAKAGLIIILLYFLYNGTDRVFEIIDSIIAGNYWIVFEIDVLFLLMSVFAIVGESASKDYYTIRDEFTKKDVINTLFRGITACFFVAAGIFIILKAIVIGILPEKILEDRYDFMNESEQPTIYYHAKNAREQGVKYY